MAEKNIVKYEFAELKHYSTLFVFIPLLCFLSVIEFVLVRISFSDFKVIFGVILLGLYLFFVYRTFFWTLFGREQVSITQDSLIISKSGTIFLKPNVYKLKEIRNIRIENREFSFLDFFASRTSLTSLKAWGCIVFDYENKAVNFGGNVNHRKAETIIEIIKQSS